MMPDAAPFPPGRALLRYYGGKPRIARWIISHFPPHKIYVEPYGGGAGVLLQKPRSYSEVYNDLDSEIVNLFRVLRDPVLAPRLVEAVTMTPYARDEFEASYRPSDDPVEQARRTLFRASAGHGSSAMTGQWRTGFRSNVTRSSTIPAHDWASYPTVLEAAIGRLRGVIIENMPALDLIVKHDSPETLFYVDPPYLLETRGRHADDGYRHNLTTQDHIDLARVLTAVQGQVLISGYDHPLYNELYAGWDRRRKMTRSDNAFERTEVLWIKPGAFSQLELISESESD